MPAPRRRLRVELCEPLLPAREGLRRRLARWGIAVVEAEELSGVDVDVVVWSPAPAEGTSALRGYRGPAPVVALLDAGAEGEAAGATAVLDRAVDPDVVAAAVTLVANGYGVARRAATPTREPIELTVREAHWIRWLASGAAVAKLAATEGYSEREMYRKLRVLYEKVGVQNRTQAVVALSAASSWTIRVDDGQTSSSVAARRSSS